MGVASEGVSCGIKAGRHLQLRGTKQFTKGISQENGRKCVSVQSDRETERDRERQRETERDRERQRETERDRERQRECVFITHSPTYS
jgi:hypothetical protein